MTRLHALIAVVFFTVTIFQITNVAVAQPLEPDIQVSPSTVTIRLSRSFWAGSVRNPEVSLNVQSLKPNVTVVDVYAETFFEEQAKASPISSRSLSFNVNQTKLDGFRRTEIRLTFDLPADVHPGSYTSKIHITSSSGFTVEVTANLKVSESEFTAGIWILLGVMLNLILFTIKDIVDNRNTLEQTVNSTDERLIKAYDSVVRAIREGRIDDLGPASNYLLAYTELLNLINNDWNRAIKKNEPAESFSRIGKKADRIVSLADEAKPASQILTVVPPEYLTPPSAFLTRKNPEDRMKYNPVLDFMLRSRNVQYLALALTFAIVVVNSWQTYLTTATTFGASGIADYLAALLFGFGSQTVLTQGVGLAKSWAESRQTRSS